jgi:GNAT superfamily N-acetyltransferase
MPTPDVQWDIQALTKKHALEAFDSSEPALDEFLKKHARQNAERGASRTFVAVRHGARLVEGYYTLRSGQVAFDILPEDDRCRLPRYPVPVVHLARLAVTHSGSGLGLGETLLMHALAKALVVEKEISVYAIEVEAKTERTRAFYAKYGFQSLLDDQLHLYVSMHAVKMACGVEEKG